VAVVCSDNTTSGVLMQPVGAGTRMEVTAGQAPAAAFAMRRSSRIPGWAVRTQPPGLASQPGGHAGEGDTEVRLRTTSCTSVVAQLGSLASTSNCISGTSPPARPIRHRGLLSCAGASPVSSCQNRSEKTMMLQQQRVPIREHRGSVTGRGTAGALLEDQMLGVPERAHKQDGDQGDPT